MEKTKPKTKKENASSPDCGDKKCVQHGSLSTRGRLFEGTVISTKMAKTVNVEWSRRFHIPKYERHEKRRSKVKAHVSPCIQLNVGDKVRIAECRPLAKTVKFVVTEKIQ